MKHLFFTAFVSIMLVGICHAQADTKVELDWETRGGPLLAIVGEQKYDTVEKLEQYLATLEAGSKVRVVYWYGPVLLGPPGPNSPLVIYAKAIKQFCTDHHLLFRESAHGT